jgi:hypothetical protein
VDDFNPVELLLVAELKARLEALKARQVIHPQTNDPVILAVQLPDQAPGDSDITKVINDATENVSPHN